MSDPTFRIAVCPDVLRPDRVDIDRQDVLDLFEHPPRTRHAGWTMWDPMRTRRTQEGLYGEVPGGGHTLLLKNGYIEHVRPVLSGFFRTLDDEGRPLPNPPLYPFPVCELPVNVTRFARDMYDLVRLDCTVTFEMQYLNIQGFRLKGYHPKAIGYDDPPPWEEPHIFDGQDFKARKPGVPGNFDPDEVAFQLVKEFYHEFGHGLDRMPLFTPDGKFDENSLSVSRQER